MWRTLIAIPVLLISCKVGSSNQEVKAVLPQQKLVSKKWLWRKLQFQEAPQARWGHTACYIPEKNAMFIIGGTNTIEIFDDVWSLELINDKEKWQQLPVKVPKLWGHSIAYDAANKKVVIFGGMNEHSDATNGVYILDLSNFTMPKLQMLKLFNMPPSPRSRCGAFYEPFYRNFVIFGGEDADGKPLSDAWSLDLGLAYQRQEARWTQLLPLGSNVPNARESFGSVYDNTGSRILLFGGSAASGNNSATFTFGDLWEGRIGSKHIMWNDIKFDPPNEDIKYKRRSVAVALYDYDKIKTISVFFGEGGGGKLSDVLMFVGLETDRPLLTKFPIDAASEIPSSRSMATAIYDEQNHRFVIFGGLSQLATNDVWTLEPSH